MKLSINKLLDITGPLSTQAGQQLKPILDYMTSAFQELIRAVSGQLSWENMRSITKTVEIQHNTDITIEVEGKVITDILVTRISYSNSAYCGFTGIAWWLDANGRPVLNISVRGAPATSISVTARLVMFYQ